MFLKDEENEDSEEDTEIEHDDKHEEEDEEAALGMSYIFYILQIGFVLTYFSLVRGRSRNGN